jgi:Golgi phosphoprotein 3
VCVVDEKMSTSGLQRRRVGGTSSEGTNTPSRGSSEGSRRYDEGGKRVAYDPEDIDSKEDERQHPRLTLMEEVLLLGLKDSQGYLSFWNDNISYVLRGCILMELAFRGKISVANDPARRRLPVCDRVVEVIDEKITGEALLDETIKIMKASEPLSVATWIDYLSGETWNLTKISYQLKQVRERLAKGLVDKGILRTEKRNFFLFDMATHPVADTGAKDEIKRRVIMMLTARTIAIPDSQYFPEAIPFRHLRSVSLVTAAYAGVVLDNVCANLSYDARDQAFNRADELLAEFSEWPFAPQSSGVGGAGANLAEQISEELQGSNASEKELQMEVVAGVINVYGRMESIL